MIVCIAEKPSVARDIANVLGATTSKTGYMEGNGYQVTWTFGHLCELKDPDDYTPMWKRWALGTLPMIPQRFGIKLKDDQGIKAQFATIEKLMQEADYIINCGDAGQEGELIQRWVMQKAGVKCPVQRLWISSLTEEAIREGFQSLKDQQEYEPLYLAGLSRAIGDWLLGMNATRLYTLKYRPQGRTNQVLSIGRVQTPTLAMIVNRQKEIDSFEPHQSWVLATTYKESKFTAIAHDEEAEAEDAAEVAEAAKNGKTQKPKGPIYRQIEYTTEEEGTKVLNAIKDNDFNVVDITKKKGTEAPPRLYDLTSLQVDCNRKFGYSADQTLQLIQSLYEKKYTTYPRVDTTFLSDDIYSKCPQTLNGLYKTQFSGVAPYAELVKAIGGKPLKKSKKVFDSSKVTDHHAIIPTGVPPQGLSDLERNVYDLVARAFIAAFYPDLKFETTTILGRVYQTPENATEGEIAPNAGELNDTNSILFRTSVRIVSDEGWKVVFKRDSASTDADNDNEDEDNTSSNISFSKGEKGPHVPSLSEKWTQPPKPYTEATLLRAMETAGKFVDNDELRDAMKENGIGRPSTRASIIETLFKRHYIRKERKNLVATPTGIELIDLIHEDILKSPELTGVWEKKLRDIEHRQYDAGMFISELKEQINSIVNQVLADNTNRRVTVIDPEEEKKKKTTKKSSAKKESKSASTAPVSSQRAQAEEAPTTCPLCGKGTIIKGKTAYGCSEWKNGCTYRKPFV
ncbi:MAG: DNA topoisomerase III [Prevotellaceae bacterium]|nr:DNA topoisomerase III [Prevotellaceae bacterium]